MKLARTTKGRPVQKRNTRVRLQRGITRSAFEHAKRLMEAVCLIAGAEDLIGNQTSVEVVQLRRAIEQHDTESLFEQLLIAFSLQGISDHAAYVFMEKHGRLTWRDVQRGTTRTPVCSKLRSYWEFHDCRYRKDAQTCALPDSLPQCPLPKHHLRNGRLNQSGYSLFLFIRDIAGGDLVEWIDSRLEQASIGSLRGRSVRMRNALVEPLTEIYGVSHKVANLTLAWLLTSAPANKPLWLEAGACMVAVDSLVHAWLHRTGILLRWRGSHPYGHGCYEPNGCADIIARVAEQIDARKFNPAYPRTFARFVQLAIWSYCSQSGLQICNARRIDDRRRCRDAGCMLFGDCDRVRLGRLP
jgi:hypothetical protein